MAIITFITYDQTCAKVDQTCAIVGQTCAKVGQTCAKVVQTCAIVGQTCAKVVQTCAKVDRTASFNTSSNFTMESAARHTLTTEECNIKYDNMKTNKTSGNGDKDLSANKISVVQ